MNRISKALIVPILLIMSSCQNSNTIDEDHTSIPLQFTSIIPFQITTSPIPTLESTLANEITPDTPLSKEGPWIIFEGHPGNLEENTHPDDYGLWALNWDGTGLTRMLDDWFIWGYQIQPSTDSSTETIIAVIASKGYDVKYHLIILSLPDERIIFQTELTNPNTELIEFPSPDTPIDEIQAEDYDRRARICQVLTDLSPIRWSPDGKKLAFLNASMSDSTDLFIYSTETNAVKRLTNGFMIGNLSWSPGSDKIAFSDITCFGSLYCSEEVWLTNIADGSVTRITSLTDWKSESEEEDKYTWRTEIIGWLTNETLATRIDMIRGDGFLSIREFDTTTLEKRVLLPEQYIFRDADYSPEEGTWLLSISYPEEGAGIYIFREGELSRIEGAEVGHVLFWSSAINRFILSSGQTIDSNGKLETHSLIEYAYLSVSPDGNYWASPSGWEKPSGVYELLEDWQTPGFWLSPTFMDMQIVFEEPLRIIHWSNDSKAILLYNPDTSALFLSHEPFSDLIPIGFFSASPILGPVFNGMPTENTWRENHEIFNFSLING